MGKKLDHPADQRVIRYAVRLPRDLYDEIDAVSRHGGWSLHAEILRRLRGEMPRRTRAARATTVPAAPALTQEERP